MFSGLPPKADIDRTHRDGFHSKSIITRIPPASCPVRVTADRHFRSAPKNRHRQAVPACPFCAKLGSRLSHSITSSAVANISGGMVQPMAFAVLRLMISSNLVTCSTGRSAGLAPFRILSTK